MRQFQNPGRGRDLRLTHRRGRFSQQAPLEPSFIQKIFADSPLQLATAETGEPQPAKTLLLIRELSVPIRQFTFGRLPHVGAKASILQPLRPHPALEICLSPQSRFLPAMAPDQTWQRIMFKRTPGPRDPIMQGFAKLPQEPQKQHGGQQSLHDASSSNL